MYVVMTKPPGEREFQFLAVFETYAEAAQYAVNCDEEILIFEEPALVKKSLDNMWP
jgi:hypothetical protein